MRNGMERTSWRTVLMLTMTLTPVTRTRANRPAKEKLTPPRIPAMEHFRKVMVRIDMMSHLKLFTKYPVCFGFDH